MPLAKTLDDANCSVCEAFFRKSVLDEQGRCPICKAAGLTGKITPITDEKDQLISEEKKRANLKALIKEIVQELREEEKWEKKEKAFAPKKCRECQKEFEPRAPHQMLCNECTGKNQ